MPELPEVQTVVNHLAKKLPGRVFLDCQIKVSKMVSRGRSIAKSAKSKIRYIKID